MADFDHLIIDAHLDLAMNAVSFDRDLTLPIDEINRAESHMNDHPARGRAVVSFPEMRRGGIALCLGTVLARESGGNRPADGFARIDFDHATSHAARCSAASQLAYYHLVERHGIVRMLETRSAIESHWDAWSSWRDRPDRGGIEDSPPVGIVLSMEGADSILDTADCRRWWDDGLRVASLVHYGRNRYASGTGTSGGLTDDGRELLREFERIGMILDVTHLADDAFYQAIEEFTGPILATHNNCRSLVPGQRQYTDDQIRRVTERGGLVCVALDAWMLYPGWVKGSSDPGLVSFKHVADQIEHIVSVAGNSDSVAIGSDLDGGFGNEQCPGECRSIADLGRLSSHLRDRGFTASEVDSVMHQNLLHFLSRHLPQE